MSKIKSSFGRDLEYAFKLRHKQIILCFKRNKNINGTNEQTRKPFELRYFEQL